MTIRALGNNVFCRVDAACERVTTYGIIIPGATRGRPDRATVEACADGLEVKAGDRVCFDAYRLKTVFGPGMLANAQGTPIANPGERFVIDLDDILFVEDKEGSDAE